MRGGVCGSEGEKLASGGGIEAEETGGSRSFFNASQSPCMTWLSKRTSRTSALVAKWERTDHWDRSFAFFTQSVSQISNSPSQSKGGGCSVPVLVPVPVPVPVAVAVATKASEDGCCFDGDHDDEDDDDDDEA